MQMRQRALARGLSLSEWGLTPVERESGKGRGASGEAELQPPNSELRTPITGIHTEERLFATLGLHYIPPELREGMGEIEIAERGELPRLVELGDVRGAFHNHTTASDGGNTLSEMAAAADALGWEYLGIADHSKSSVVANGLSVERLLKQIADIRALNVSKRFKTHVVNQIGIVYRILKSKISTKSKRSHVPTRRDVFCKLFLISFLNSFSA